MVSPLAQIGRSNDPSLAKRAVNTSSAADALVQSMMKQGLTNKGLMARQGKVNALGLKKALIAAGYPYDEDANPALRITRDTAQTQGYLSNMDIADKLGIRGLGPQLGDTLASVARGDATTRPVGKAIPRGERVAAAGAQVDTGTEVVKGVRPTSPRSLAMSEPVITTKQRRTKKPLTFPKVTLPGAPKAAPVKPATKTKAKPQQGETADRKYRSFGGYTGWWAKNPKTGKWNPE